jgi:hypothetical protein
VQCKKKQRINEKNEKGKEKSYIFAALSIMRKNVKKR